MGCFARWVGSGVWGSIVGVSGVGPRGITPKLGTEGTLQVGVNDPMTLPFTRRSLAIQRAADNLERYCALEMYEDNVSLGELSPDLVLWCRGPHQ